MNNTVPFFRHNLGQAEISAITEVIQGAILTTGEKVDQFERMFAHYLKSNFAIGTTSCTGAMHMSLLALGIGQGDEVITTPLTFIATATAILEAGAIPVFVDVEEDTGNIDVTKIENAITERTKAILPVHLYGHMCDMHGIKKIADSYHLNIIEDAAHCIEGERDGIKPGMLSDTAAFSFYATKNITCGEGGAIVCNNPILSDQLKLLRLHGMTKTAADRFKEGYRHWDMKILGWKYNMDNIQAAMLIPQLLKIDDQLAKRESLAKTYLSLIHEISGVIPFSTKENTVHARHLFPIRILNADRDNIIKGLQRSQIGVVVNYRAIHLLSYFSERFHYKKGDFPIAERLGNQVVSLPFYLDMTTTNIKTVTNSLKQLLSP